MTPELLLLGDGTSACAHVTAILRRDYVGDGKNTLAQVPVFKGSRAKRWGTV